MGIASAKALGVIGDQRAVEALGDLLRDSSQHERCGGSVLLHWEKLQIQLRSQCW